MTCTAMKFSKNFCSIFSTKYIAKIYDRDIKEWTLFCKQIGVCPAKSLEYDDQFSKEDVHGKDEDDEYGQSDFETVLAEDTL